MILQTCLSDSEASTLGGLELATFFNFPTVSEILMTGILEGVHRTVSQILPKNVKFDFTNMFNGFRSLNLGGVQTRDFFKFPNHF